MCVRQGGQVQGPLLDRAAEPIPDAVGSGVTRMVEQGAARGSQIAEQGLQLSGDSCGLDVVEA